MMFLEKETQSCKQFEGSRANGYLDKFKSLPHMWSNRHWWYPLHELQHSGLLERQLQSWIEQPLQSVQQEHQKSKNLEKSGRS
jgi:hypothetical protein